MGWDTLNKKLGCEKKFTISLIYQSKRKIIFNFEYEKVNKDIFNQKGIKNIIRKSEENKETERISNKRVNKILIIGFYIYKTNKMK